MRKELRVVKMGNEDDDNLYQALLNIQNPRDIGTVLMYYILNNYGSEKERIEVIRSIVNNLFNDFFAHELPEGELARIRKLINMI